MTVKGPLLPALLLAVIRGAPAAENLNDAARDAARKAAAFAGTVEPVALSFRNISSLGGAEAARARRLFETGLREAGVRVLETAPAAEVRVTVAENPGEWLLVGEERRGGERQVWIASWPRAASGGEPTHPGASLEKRLLWEADEQILDVALAPDAMLVLTPAKLTLYGRRDGAWEARESAPVAAPGRWPRDLRGRVQAAGPALRVFLPGVACSGAWQPSLAIECKPGEEAWVLESGSRSMLLGTYAATRNYFDGRIVTQAGLRKSVVPFYTAAAVEDGGGPLWLLAGVDGRTQIYDASFEPAGSVAAWGSDIAGTDARCGGGQQVLATRPDESSEAVQAFSIVNRQPEALSAPLAMPGPVTALWPAGAGAVAVTRAPQTGRYAAYLLTISCGS
jgi:hypothetical protein